MSRNQQLILLIGVFIVVALIGWLLVGLLSFRVFNQTVQTIQPTLDAIGTSVYSSTLAP